MYYVVIPWDQTIMFWGGDRWKETGEPALAELYPEREQAEKVATEVGGVVCDLKEGQTELDLCLEEPSWWMDDDAPAAHKKAAQERIAALQEALGRT